MCYPLKIEFSNHSEAKGYKRALDEVFEVLGREKEIAIRTIPTEERRISQQEATAAFQAKGMADMADNIQVLFRESHKKVTDGDFSLKEDHWAEDYIPKFSPGDEIVYKKHPGPVLTVSSYTGYKTALFACDMLNGRRHWIGNDRDWTLHKAKNDPHEEFRKGHVDALNKILVEAGAMQITAYNHAEESLTETGKIHWRGVEFAANELKKRTEHLLFLANQPDWQQKDGNPER